MNRRPDVLILHADQLRYDGLGCDGNPHARTPHIDAIAGEGTVFTRHIASNPICMPSRASLATGLYPSGHNVWDNGVCLPRRGDTGPVGSWPLPPGHRPPATIADVFAAAGYDTASFGKLHFTSNRADRAYGGAENWALMDAGGLRGWHGPYYGFRHVEMTKGHAEEPCESGHYADWLAEHHPAVRAAALAPKDPSAYPLPGRRDLYASPVPSELHCSRWLADRFAAWLDTQSADRPFFAFVGFPDPHHAFTPSHDLAALFRDAPVREPSDPAGAGWQRSPVREILAHRHCIANLPPEDIRWFVRYTYAMVHGIDLAVGRIVAALQRAGRWRDTIVVVTSDHGDFLGDHGLLLKRLVGSDALLRVPFVLRAPGSGLPARVERVMSNCDVLPTLAGLAGVAAPAGLHGRDIRPVAVGADGHRALAQCATGEPAGRNLTIYDDRYRLTWWPHCGTVELFDHYDDPDEARDLGGSGHPEEARLLAELKERHLCLDNPMLGKIGAW